MEPRCWEESQQEALQLHTFNSEFNIADPGGYAGFTSLVDETVPTPDTYRHIPEPPSVPGSLHKYTTLASKKGISLPLCILYVSFLVIGLWLNLFLTYTNMHLSSTQAHTHIALATLLYPWVRITLWGSISPGWTIYPPYLTLNPIQYKQLYPFSCSADQQRHLYLEQLQTHARTQCTNAPRSVQLSANE